MGEKFASLNAVRTSRMHWAQSVSTINNLRVCHLVSYFGRRRLSLLACIGHLFKQPPPSLSLVSDFLPAFRLFCQIEMRHEEHVVCHPLKFKYV